MGQVSLAAHVRTDFVRSFEGKGPPKQSRLLPQTSFGIILKLVAIGRWLYEVILDVEDSDCKKGEIMLLLEIIHVT